MENNIDTEEKHLDFPEEEAVARLKFEGLVATETRAPVKLMYDACGQERVVFWQERDGTVTLDKDKLMLYDAEGRFMGEKGFWLTVKHFNSMYANLRSALRENAPLLKDYHEEKSPVTLQMVYEIFTPNDREVNRQLYQKTSSLGRVCLISGAVGLMACAILFALFFRQPYGLWSLVLLLSLIPFGFGLYLSSVCNRAIENTDVAITYHYLFEDTFLTVSSERGNHPLSTRTIYYSAVEDIIETKDYLFAFVQDGSVYPIGKEGLDDEEVTLLKSFFGKGDLSDVAC